MSFSTDAKLELLEAERKDCCKEAFLYGFLLFSKRFSAKKIEVTSKSPEITDYCFAQLTGLGVPESTITTVNKTASRSLVINDRTQADRLFNDFNHSDTEPYLTIKKENFKCPECVNSFCAGVFTAAGSLADPGKEYNLEIVSNRMHLTNQFVELVSAYNFDFTIRTRGNKYISYIKNSDLIVDFLTFIGANNASIDIINLKIYKDIRNNTNRRVNFESANIDKTINAAQDDIEAINFLKRNNYIDSLTDDLKEVAELRVANPELSLAELGQLTAKTLSKSGIAHRLKKIRQASAEFKKGDSNAEQ